MKKLVVLFMIALAIPLLITSVAGCQQSTPDVVEVIAIFPLQSQPEVLYPAGNFKGKLVLENDYLRIKPIIGDSDLLIWPYGYSLRIEGKIIRVIDDNGQTVARVGDIINVGGGEVSAMIVEKYIGQPLPDNYTGPYWLVSEVEE